MRRAVATIVVVASLLLGASLPVVGHNWGAGSWGGESIACLEEDEDGECTAYDNAQSVYFGVGLPSDVKAAILATMSSDYTIPNEFSAYETGWYPADVEVVLADNRAEGFWIYETCADPSNHGGGTGYYEWCYPHRLYVDPSMIPGSCGSNCKAYLACHEFGHTTGLQHPGAYPSVGANRITCMDYDHDQNLHDHEKEHLIDCYPRPNPAPYTLTPACDNYAG